MSEYTWYQSNDLDQDLADSQLRWAGSPALTLQFCPACGSDEIYGNGPGARELACPHCGLQYNPADYCSSCGDPLPPEDVARGERICAECCPLVVFIDVSPDDPLSASIHIGLA